MRISALETSEDLENDGVWANFHADVEFKIGSINSNAYRRVLVRQANRQRGFRAFRMDPAATDQNNAELLSHVLLGWRNVNDDDDEPIVHSREMAEKLLLKYVDIRDFVMTFTMDNDNFRKAAVAADAEVLEKNSGSASSGAGTSSSLKKRPERGKT